MIRGKLSSGFEFHLDENIFDDFELVELYAKVAKNPIWIGDLAERLLGAEQTARSTQRTCSTRSRKLRTPFPRQKTDCPRRHAIKLPRRAHL